MTITNKLNLPAGFVKAVSAEKHNESGCLSATTLLQGLRQIILSDRHWEELEDDVADRIWAIWGTAVHSLLETEGDDDFSEQKVSYKVGGVTITGRIDNYDMKNGVISDYKTASVNKIKFNDFSDWHSQGMIYAWLLMKNGFPIKACRFIALLKDHSKTEAGRDCQYPQNPVYIYEFPVNQVELFKIGSFITNKVKEYQRYVDLPDEAIPLCSAGERWERPSVFAVRKEGRKTAVRLFDDKDEAEQKVAELGAGHFVEHRQGESVKCRNYCLCRRICNAIHETAASAPVAESEKEINAGKIAA